MNNYIMTESIKNKQSCLEQHETQDDSLSLENQFQYLKGKAEAHADEIERVRSETIAQTTAELEKQYTSSLKKAKTDAEILRSIIEIATKTSVEESSKGPKKKWRGRPKSKTEKVTISIRITKLQRSLIDKFQEEGIIKMGEISEMVSGYLQEKINNFIAKIKEIYPEKSYSDSCESIESDDMP